MAVLEEMEIFIEIIPIGFAKGIVCRCCRLVWKILVSGIPERMLIAYSEMIGYPFLLSANFSWLLSRTMRQTLDEMMQPVSINV